MVREYHKWHSSRLGREMELLVFGHAGLPVMVFPTSGGRFYEFEDRGMIGALAGKIDAGQLQVYCVDSVDMESWYNRNVPPRWRIARHMQYDDYVIHEVVPLVRQKNQDPHLVSLGCSFGGYHAVNVALRHPDVFTGLLSMSGAFDFPTFSTATTTRTATSISPRTSCPTWAIRGFSTATAQHLHAGHRLGRPVPGPEPEPRPDHERQGTFRTSSMSGTAMNSHDWPTWQRMVREYL